jgi:hypothetical protein
VKFKDTDFVDAMVLTVLHDLHFSLNQPLKLVGDWYIAVLKNVIKTYKYVDIVLFQLVLIFPVTELDVGLDSLTLLSNTVFNIKHKLCVASGSAHFKEKFWVHL